MVKACSRPRTLIRGAAKAEVVRKSPAARRAGSIPAPGTTTGPSSNGRAYFFAAFASISYLIRPVFRVALRSQIFDGKFNRNGPQQKVSQRAYTQRLVATAPKENGVGVLRIATCYDKLAERSAADSRFRKFLVQAPPTASHRHTRIHLVISLSSTRPKIAATRFKGSDP